MSNAYSLSDLVERQGRELAAGALRRLGQEGLGESPESAQQQWLPRLEAVTGAVSRDLRAGWGTPEQSENTALGSLPYLAQELVSGTGSTPGALELTLAALRALREGCLQRWSEQEGPPRGTAEGSRRLRAWFDRLNLATTEAWLKRAAPGGLAPPPSQDARPAAGGDGSGTGSPDRARALLDAHTDLAVLLDAEGHILEANAACALALSESGGQYRGRSILDYLPPERTEEARAIVRQTAQDGCSRWGELHAGGRDLTVAIRRAPGAPGLVAAFARDLSDLRRAAQAATESQRLAAVGQLASGVAHEFNNLLFMMSARAQLAELEAKPQYVDKLIEVVRMATARGAQICQNLISFARPQPPEQTIAPLTVPLEGALTLAERELTNAGINVVRDWAEDQPLLEIDTSQMQQVFLNLLLNACEAMPGGGVLRLSITSAEGCGGPAEVRVSLRDSGYGISEQNLPLIFNPFFTTKGVLGGGRGTNTGLGLSISLGLVQANRGQMHLESQLGRGTTVTLCFPVPESCAGETRQATPSPTTRRGEPGALRVLLVDDEPELLAALAALLQTAGFRVRTAPGGAEAVRVATQEGFDAVLCDLLMPGMSGDRVVAQLAEDRPGLPVVILTGKCEEELEAQLLAQGAAAVVRKPVDYDRLVETLRQAARR